MFLNDDIYYFLSDMTENEKRKEGDYLMTCFVMLVWTTMKGYIARRNVNFKMTDVIQLTHDAIAAVTEDDWVSSCRHVEEVERKYWDANIAVKAEMEKIVIQVTSSDEDTDTATECSDYSDTESADEVY